MSYSLKELLALKLEPALMGKCFCCGKPILDFEEYRRIPLGGVHDDCYYDDLGRMLETSR